MTKQDLKVKEFLAQHGFDISNYVPMNVSDSEGKVEMDFVLTEQELKETGVMSLVIDRIVGNVKAYLDSESQIAEFEVTFKYKHVGSGSNGKSARYVTDGEKVITYSEFYENRFTI